MDEKSYESILIYDVAWKPQYGAKPSPIIFDKLDGYIRIYDRTKYLPLFHSEKNMREFLIELDISLC